MMDIKDLEVKLRQALDGQPWEGYGYNNTVASAIRKILQEEGYSLENPWMLCGNNEKYDRSYVRIEFDHVHILTVEVHKKKGQHHRGYWNTGYYDWTFRDDTKILYKAADTVEDLFSYVVEQKRLANLRAMDKQAKGVQVVKYIMETFDCGDYEAKELANYVSQHYWELGNKIKAETQN